MGTTEVQRTGGCSTRRQPIWGWWTILRGHYTRWHHTRWHYTRWHYTRWHYTRWPVIIRRWLVRRWLIWRRHWRGETPEGQHVRHAHQDGAQARGQPIEQRLRNRHGVYGCSP